MTTTDTATNDGPTAELTAAWIALIGPGWIETAKAKRILYLADVWTMTDPGRHGGQLLPGTTWFKDYFGPTPAGMSAMRRRLVRDRVLEERRVILHGRDTIEERLVAGAKTGPESPHAPMLRAMAMAFADVRISDIVRHCQRSRGWLATGMFQPMRRDGLVSLRTADLLASMVP